MREATRAVIATATLALLLVGAGAHAEEEPELPAGLAGLDDEPPLPAGLGDDLATETAASEEEEGLLESLPFDLTGFVDTRAGIRTQDDPDQDQASLGELRAQLAAERAWDRVTARLTFDLLYDEIAREHQPRLESGRGWFDLREAFLSARVSDQLDLKIGRQILTWGTGDLIFINDLFAKDFASFFAGRDTSYLKAPSDALKASLFTTVVNLDVVYTPRFDADRFIDGRRISFYSASAGERIGHRAAISVDRRDEWFHEDELALRLHGAVGAFELRAYGYFGYWKSPGGFDPASGRATFPKLFVYGASARGPIAGGIVHGEFGYYDSRDDRDGDAAMVRNSELRFLLGYERELSQDLTVGLQYYLEELLDYDAYEHSLPAGATKRDEHRHTVTLRLTQLLLQQNLEIGLFVFWTPSDEDVYLRPRASYKLTDAWRVEAGANVFAGAEPDTSWGQFEKNSNVYVALRFGF
ncbi:MAG: hypothetical protein GY944_02630 [bacterium]|nr:hypothetical protein [bacterium]